MYCTSRRIESQGGSRAPFVELEPLPSTTGIAASQGRKRQSNNQCHRVALRGFDRHCGGSARSDTHRSTESEMCMAGRKLAQKGVMRTTALRPGNGQHLVPGPSRAFRVQNPSHCCQEGVPRPCADDSAHIPMTCCCPQYPHKETMCIAGACRPVTRRGVPCLALAITNKCEGASR